MPEHSGHASKCVPYFLCSDGAEEDRLAEVLKADTKKQIKAVAVVHNETTTGTVWHGGLAFMLLLLPLSQRQLLPSICPSIHAIACLHTQASLLTLWVYVQCWTSSIIQRC